MKLLARILGCGSSGGVPRIGGEWGACDPANPKNRRRRCSLLLRAGPAGLEGPTTDVLIDTAPDLREQLIDAGLGRLDGVLYTHEHADQVAGIDDLRVVAINMRQRVPVYMDAHTGAELRQRFHYCFTAPAGSPYPPILDAHEIVAGTPFAVDGPGGPMALLGFDQDHGTIRSLGFRIGPLAYSPDLVDLPDSAFEALAGVECWIVDALRYRPHPTHSHLEKTLGWIERLGCRAVLTNMHVDLDYDRLSRELPDHVEPAYDGMELSFTL
ncbi:MAG: MBL fold metallo-hydrolase [Alphaproteobacteria bacterium]|nr:MBL fold metallo-hydrolase [Alphaproteobacteria bacterium]